MEISWVQLVVSGLAGLESSMEGGLAWIVEG